MKNIVTILAVTFGLACLGYVVQDNYNFKVRPEGKKGKETSKGVIVEKSDDAKKASIIKFTDDKNQPIGQLEITDKIGFSGSLDASGLIFITYVASQLGLHCDELKEQSPLKKPATSTPAKK